MLNDASISNKNSNLNDEWLAFMNVPNKNDEIIKNEHVSKFENVQAPEPTPIYISTKSKISYLNVPVNLNIFWNISIIPYSLPLEGCIKKQARITTTTLEDFNEIQSRLINEKYVEQFIVCHIDNPNGRIKFKDIRKISIGIYKKDLMSKTKNKEAFYNCLVLIMRIKINNMFREFHVKLFNTGKIEIPGIKNDETYQIVLQKLIEFIQPFYKDISIFCKPNNDIILINSNFNCGFYINRENLINILKNKYNITPIYDPCNYPGVKAPFYYNPNVSLQNGMQVKPEDKNKDEFKNVIKIHCSIFRTGSVLILGTCNETILNEVYTFLTNLLKTEFKHICSDIINESNKPKSNKDKKRKSQKKFIVYEDTVQDIDHEDLIDTSLNSNSEFEFEYEYEYEEN